MPPATASLVRWPSALTPLARRLSLPVLWLLPARAPLGSLLPTGTLLRLLLPTGTPLRSGLPLSGTGAASRLLPLRASSLLFSAAPGLPGRGRRVLPALLGAAREVLLTPLLAPLAGLLSLLLPPVLAGSALLSGLLASLLTGLLASLLTLLASLLTLLAPLLAGSALLSALHRLFPVRFPLTSLFSPGRSPRSHVLDRTMIRCRRLSLRRSFVRLVAVFRPRLAAVLWRRLLPGATAGRLLTFVPAARTALLFGRLIGLAVPPVWIGVWIPVHGKLRVKSR